ncbi:MAG TPA: SxtJ family membrane protein [Pyrinomonadaceae bacterium]|nr:SxtJ family membrane protein [Pyrinomonadaceae bacterium]
MKKRFRAERDFGLIVGGVLLLLSGWWIYRGKLTGAVQFTLPLSVLLIVLGIVFPRALVYPNKVWMLIAEVLAFVSTRIILALVFFLMITPIGVVKRWFGWDPLSRRSGSRESYWQPYDGRQRNARHYEKMY